MIASKSVSTVRAGLCCFESLSTLSSLPSVEDVPSRLDRARGKRASKRPRVAHASGVLRREKTIAVMRMALTLNERVRVLRFSRRLEFGAEP